MAAQFLRSLSHLGVECIYANPGSEFIPIIEAYNALRAQGVTLPRAVTVPHEALAVSMAYGHYLATGRPQAVMVHVTVGTANALMGLINASRMNVPILFIAGRTPLTESGTHGGRDRFVHWAQESFDQGAMTREFVKWDYEVRLPQSLGPALCRAWSLMQAAPKGPVSLMFSREVLCQEASGEIPVEAPRSTEKIYPSPAAMERICLWLRESQRPVLLTSRSGMDRNTVTVLERAVEQLQIPVFCPQSQAVNIRTGHECFSGYADAACLREADFVLVLDTDVPWLPHQTSPPADAKIVHVGEDPLFARIPMRGFTSHLNVVSDGGAFLQALAELNFPANAARTTWRKKWRERYVQSQDRLRGNLARQDNLSGDGIAQALSRVLDKDTILVNELSLPPELLNLDFAGSYWRSGSASGLGWGLGCALGIKLASSEKIPIAVVGDGVYHLSNPLGAHWAGLTYDLPVLTLILNNEGMRSVHSEGTFTALKPSLPFAEIAQAMGVWSRRTESLSQLQEDLTQAIAQVRSGKTAVIDARLSY